MAHEPGPAGAAFAALRSEWAVSLDWKPPGT